MTSHLCAGCSGSTPEKWLRSVLENGLSSHVSVRNAALGQSSGAMTELIHFRGHNGQASIQMSAVDICFEQSSGTFWNVVILLVFSLVFPSTTLSMNDKIADWSLVAQIVEAH